MESFIDFLSTVPPWIATMVLAMTPVGELRLAIPVAAHVWLVHPANAFGLAVLGNLLPFFPLFFGLEAVRKWCEHRVPWVERVIQRSIERAHTKLQHRYERYGALALFLFTALPLPFTGLWTATIAAVALKVPFKYAFIGIASGVVVSGILVTVLSVSADVFF